MPSSAACSFHALPEAKEIGQLPVELSWCLAMAVQAATTENGSCSSARLCFVFSTGQTTWPNVPLNRVLMPGERAQLD